MPSDWTSYDTAAATHDAISVPAIFLAPARDLAARLDLATARTALDVGAGSGVLASAISAAGVPVVAACDPSLEMLRRARANGIAPVAVAGLPHLPFPNAAFDRVAASFVLSHIPSYRDGLREMIRVLRPGGKLGATAWSLLANPYRDLADDMAREAVGADRFQQSTSQWLPWEDHLADPANLQAALVEAGLRDIAVEEIEYPIHITIADFLATRETSGVGRLLSAVLDPDSLRLFWQDVRAEFAARFQDPIDHVRRALIAVGAR